MLGKKQSLTFVHLTFRQTNLNKRINQIEQFTTFCPNVSPSKHVLRKNTGEKRQAKLEKN